MRLPFLARATDRSAAGRRNRRGSYSPIIGLLIWVVVGFGALSVDVSLMTMANLQAQATADAAAHAALVGYNVNLSTGEGDSAANFVIKENKVALGQAHLDEVTYGTWDYDLAAFDGTLNPGQIANAVRARVSRNDANSNPVNTLLAGMIGRPDFEVDAQSIATQQRRAIMLALDVSCSMMDGNSASNSSPVAIMRLATDQFYTYISDRPQAGDQFGIAMYAEWGAIEPTNPLPWGTTCPYFGGCPSGGGVRPLDTDPPWLPLTLIEDYDALIRERIGGVCDTMDTSPAHQCAGAGNAPKPEMSDVGACTNPEVALLQAIDELTLYADDTYFRGILFMSDGLPNCGTAAAAQDAADHAWDDFGISIWTIAVTSGSANAFMSSMPRGIGFSQSSSNAAQLPAMFKKVAQSLPTVFVD